MWRIKAEQLTTFCYTASKIMARRAMTKLRMQKLRDLNLPSSEAKGEQKLKASVLLLSPANKLPRFQRSIL